MKATSLFWRTLRFSLSGRQASLSVWYELEKYFEVLTLRDAVNVAAYMVMSAGQYLNKFTFRTMELFNVHRYVHHLCMVQEWRVISPLICYVDVSQEEHICYVDVGHVCIFAKWWPNLHQRLFDTHKWMRWHCWVWKRKIRMRLLGEKSQICVK